MVNAREQVNKLEARVDETYLLSQYDQTTSSDSWNEAKKREDDFIKLYRGNWADLYPDGTDAPGKPLIENIVKNGVHDLSSLASEVRPAVIFVPEGEEQRHYVDARVKAAIADTYWDFNHGDVLQKRLYMDMVGSGMAVLACSFQKGKPYPTMTRLKPSRCWPDVRNGIIQDLLYIERMKVREIKRMYPNLDLGEGEAWCGDEGRLVDYYNGMEVVKAVILLGENGRVDKQHTDSSVYIVDRWEHGLEQFDAPLVPVAFTQMPTYDDAFRGLYDQAGPPVLTRNRIIQYVTDYMYDMVHAPYEEKNIRNFNDPPGPDTVYHHDQIADQSFMRRVAPAAPAGAVFGIVQYLETQSSGESLQPPSRQGQVSQSIASASFVAATQGRLTSVIKDLQDMHSYLRQQATYIMMQIDGKHLDKRKPLWHTVGNKKTYKPSSDIGDFVYCDVEFGAAAGIGKGEADVRVLQHRGAKAISLQTMREQLDYVPDPTSEQQKIDREDSQEAFKQRLLADPRMPLGVVAKINILMDQGKTLQEAAEEVLPELQQADQAAQNPQAQPGQPGAGAEGGAPPGEPTPDAGLEQNALLKGGTETQPAAIPSVEFQPPPLQTQLVRSGG